MTRKNFFLASLITFICACEKAPDPKLLETEIKENIIQKTNNVIPGNCPYPCPDSRCDNYEFPCPENSDIALVNSIGSTHNNMLADVEAVNLQNSDSNALATAFHNTLLASANSEGIYPSLLRSNNNKQEIYSLIRNNFYLLSENAVDSATNSKISQISPSLTTREYSLLYQTKLAFNFSTNNLSYNAQFDTLINRLSTLKFQFNQINWLPNEGLVVGGYINIAYNSAMYWKFKFAPPIEVLSIKTQKESNVSLAKALPVRAIIWPQADALGYLSGWFKSWYIDEEPKASVRIKNGLYTAAQFSGLKGLP